MAIENLQERLALLDDEFNSVEPAETGGFQRPPLGEHECLVDSWDFFEGKQGGIFLKLITKISGGEHGGKECSILYTLDDAARWKWLKKDLGVLGLQDGEYRLSDLVPGSEVLGRTLDTPVLINVVEDKKGRTDNDGVVYRNVYLQQRLGEPGSAGSSFTPASDVPGDQGEFAVGHVGRGATDDDIPF